MRQPRLHQQSRHEAQGARFASLFGLDEEGLLEESGFDALTGNDGLRDSANSCSQRLKSGQFDDERV